MLNGGNTVREGRPDTIEYGNHTHQVNQVSCGTCERENEAFDKLVKANGAHYVEDRMHRLPSYRAYAQKWPFDLRKKVLSAEDVFVENESPVYVEGYYSRSTLEAIMDQEAVDELLADLTDEEKQAIVMTVEGYKPREIAEHKGDKNSARVRQDKYAANRKLGAPINEKMRRVK